MTSESQRLVSIGLPVYNGEKYLRNALTTLLAQDYSHFELIISDNNSNDGTEAICREFAAKDSRIRYIRQPQNQGPLWNFEFVLQESRGEYFMWAAHDDLWEPSYIRKCLEALQSHPEAVLCCTEVNFIDGEGNPSPFYPGFKNLETVGLEPVERIHCLIARMGWYAIYGLMRPEAIREVKSLGVSAFGIDVVMTLELLLMGHIVKVHEPLLHFRIEKGKTADDYKASFKSERGPAPAMELPYTGLALDLLRTVYASELSSQEKRAAFADFMLVMSSSHVGWRAVITQELLGPAIALNDAGFAYVLGQVLARTVPMAELRENPLMQALYRPPKTVPDILTLAKIILGQNGSAPHLPPREKHRQGSLLFEQGKLEEASRLFADTIREEETSERWTDWAAVQIARERRPEAEQGLERALELDNNNTLAALKLGILMAGDGRFDNAISYLERALPKLDGPKRAQAAELLSNCRMKLAARAAR
jgi:glycosyltransferase involved in cell wall biosynthesis